MMQRQTISFTLTAILGALSISLNAEPLAKVPESGLKLWYREAARNWGSALALGNGRLGAMVFGGVELERIGLNEDTLWSGGPYEPSTEVSSATREEILKLMFAGTYGDAQNLSNKLQGTPNSQASYQTIGEIRSLSRGTKNPRITAASWI